MNKLSISLSIIILAAIGVACFYSITLTFLLIIFFCVFRFWDFARQPIIRRRPMFSLGILFFILIFLSGNDTVLQKEMQRNGCHIVSALVKSKHMSKGSRGRELCHTVVEFRGVKGRLISKSINDKKLYHESIINRHVIISEAINAPEKFLVLDCFPSDSLVKKMNNGVYAKGDITNLDSIESDEQVRQSFINYYVSDTLSFFKNYKYLIAFVMLIISIVLSYFGDREGVFATFISISIFTLLCMLTHQKMSILAIVCLVFDVIVLKVFIEFFSKSRRVKNEIKRNGGFIAMGICLEVKSGKSVHSEVSFVDAMGNYCQEIINKNYKNAVIIAHSTFNDIDVICLDEKPSEKLLKEFKNGKFIGPCSEIDLNRVQEDKQSRIIYESLYTPKEM